MCDFKKECAAYEAESCDKVNSPPLFCFEPLLIAEKEPVAEVPCSVGLEGHQPSEAMLTAAMNKAVEVGIVAKWADEETYLKNWAGMKEILKAAMAD